MTPDRRTRVSQLPWCRGRVPGTGSSVSYSAHINSKRVFLICCIRTGEAVSTDNTVPTNDFSFFQTMESNQVNSSIQLEIPEESCWTSGYWGSQVNIRESFKNVIFYSTPTECKNRRRRKKKNSGTGLELVGGGESWAKVMGQIVETTGSVKLEMGSVVGCVECHMKLISSSLHFTPSGSWVWGLPGLEQWLSSNTQVWNSEFRPWTCTSLTTYWEPSRLETGERERPSIFTR